MLKTQSLTPEMVEAYLKRIGLTKTIPDPTPETLNTLHRQHLSHIPFENLDVRQQKTIRLGLNPLFKKVVEGNRGGFCYELNYLFAALLKAIGFKVTLVAVRIYKEDGKLGRPFDHLSLLVHQEETWFADIGYGDLFLKPLPLIANELFSERRNVYRFEEIGKQEYNLWRMQKDENFKRVYRFSTEKRKISDFKEECSFKQYSPESYFVQNLICTRATKDGRITIFNDELVITNKKGKKKKPIKNEKERNQLLKKHFDMDF